MKNGRVGRWLAVAVAAVMGVSAAAETRDVKLPNTSLLAKKSAMSAKLAQLKRGDSLDVLGTEGSWLKVRYGGQEGYVHENNVGKPGEQIRAGSGKAGSASAAEAGRGVGESAEWAKATGKSTAGLDRMVKLREQIGEGELEKFAAEGNVGPGKK